MKRTFQPSNRRRKRRIGFMARMDNQKRTTGAEAPPSKRPGQAVGLTSVKATPLSFQWKNGGGLIYFKVIGYDVLRTFAFAQ